MTLGSKWRYKMVKAQLGRRLAAFWPDGAVPHAAGLFFPPCTSPFDTCDSGRETDMPGQLGGMRLYGLLLLACAALAECHSWAHDVGGASIAATADLEPVLQPEIACLNAFRSWATKLAKN